MARILVNYIYNKMTDQYEIQKGGYVFADQRVAVLETEEPINRPLVVPIRNQLTVVDRDRYEAVNKRFYLVADDKGNVKEDVGGAEVWLPKDTDISKLRYINNQLVMVDDEPKKEQEQEQEAVKETKKKSSHKKEA